MSVRLRNTSGEALYLSSRQFGQRVEADEVIDVDGKLVDESGDAYVVGEGKAARAYPKAHWTDAGGPPARKTDRSEEK